MSSRFKKILSAKALSKYGKLRANRKFVDWNNAMRIQFLYAANILTAEDAVPLVAELYKIQNLCKEEGKTPFFVIYSPFPIDSAPLENVLTVSKKDCGRFTSRPRKESLAEFGGYAADLLVNLSTADSYQLEFYAAASSASFKTASTRQTDVSFKYDFLVAANPENPETSANSPLAVFKAIRYYLQMIKPA